MKLYILNYNNYFNRKLMRLEKISDYSDYIVLTADNISFNPNDGKQTTQILNKYESGDYLICTENKETTVNGYVIDLSNSLSLSLIRDFTNPKITAIDAYNYAAQIGTGKVLFDTFISKLETLTTLTSTSISDWLEKDMGEEYDVISKEEVTTTVETINSRWFILEANRTRQGQYNLSLKRDVLADNLDVIEDAPMFVEKAMLKDTDKMIINNEGMQFNQIKSNEILLKDKSNCPWIVGYVAKNFGGNTVSTDVDINLSGDIVKDYTTIGNLAKETGLSEELLINMITLPGAVHQEQLFSENIQLIYGLKVYGGIGMEYGFRSWYTGDLVYDSYTQIDIGSSYLKGGSSLLYAGNGATKTGIYETPQNIATSINNYTSAIKEELSDILNRKYYASSTDLSKLSNAIGKGVTVLYLGVYYKLTLKQLGYATDTNTGLQKYQTYGTIGTAIDNATYGKQISVRSDGDLRVISHDIRAYLQLEDISEYKISGKISSSRNVVSSEAFDIFVMPYSDIYFDYQGETFVASGELSTKVASDIVTRLDNQCYDIQLLPYCPVPDMLDSHGEINTDNFNENNDYNLLKAEKKKIQTSYTVSGNMTYDEVTDEYVRTIDMSTITDFKLINYKQLNPKVISITDLSVVTVNGKVTIVFKADTLERANEAIIELDYTYTMSDYPVGIILYPTKNDFKVKLDYSLSLTHSMKVESQVDTYRLCSPNYQGSFDFNVAKNGGKVECFYADCTYKPYNPYIRVYPKFDWLYGSNYGDARGLICGGDFSLPRITSAWQSYELNNKNYQNTFNRDIQYLDFNNSISMRNQMVSSAIGVLQAGSEGAVRGMKLTGSPWGAAAGAAIGTAASTVGAIVDTDTLARQQKENKQLSIDKYNYQLGNIQALPYTISKVGSFDINSKLYPFIEYYTASEEEVKTLEDKITYESMTVMRIGTISEFKQDEPTYIKGQLIRLDDLHTDTNLINDIYTELYKGVYY